MPRQKTTTCLLLFVFLLFWGAGTALAQPRTLILLTTSDMQGHLEPFKVKAGDVSEEQGGLARMATAIKRVKRLHPGQVLTVATGDDLMGRYFLQFHGRAIYEVMAAVGIELTTLGNHEFDLGPKVLAEARKHCRFPVVLSNLTAPQASPLAGWWKKTIIVNRAGLKVGFLGLICPDLAQLTRTEGAVTVEPELFIAARQAVKDLNQQGVDLIVALTHIGLEADRGLAAQVDGIDVIVGGHSHDLIPTGGEVIVTRSPNQRTIIVQTGRRSNHLGQLKLTVTGQGVSDHDWRVITLDPSIEEDSQTAALIAAYQAKLPPSRVIAQSLVKLDCLKATVRGGEAPVGNLITDIMRQRFGAEVALLNGGNIRGDRVIPAGPINSADIEAMLPFGNTVDILEISGQTLIETLEHGLSGLAEGAGRFLQVSGLKFSAKAGRVVRAEVLGSDGSYAELEAGQSYTVATNAYLAGGGGGFTMLADQAASRHQTYVSLSSLVQMMLKSRGQVDPRIEGRITLQN
ncbi:MAG: bifunctional metallophosphatase/5'-nucleotidase [Deltaproteobacteria bacterium]|nr:bifunctional metallophosphatase/5'-nucleotidase [Deltaproteobacteria bacterium]